MYSVKLAKKHVLEILSINSLDFRVLPRILSHLKENDSNSNVSDISISSPLLAPRLYASENSDPTTVLLRVHLAALRREELNDSESRHTASNDAQNALFTTLTNKECGFHVHMGIDPSVNNTYKTTGVTVKCCREEG
jgi:hypothetical protein